MLAPGPVPLFLLVPQTVYFLVYAYAPSGNSDMAKIFQEAYGWKALARPGKGWVSRWREAQPRQRAIEAVRLSLTAFLVVFIGITDLVLLGLYAAYRFVRKLLNRI
jgi:hypothetical protein